MKKPSFSWIIDCIEVRKTSCGKGLFTIKKIKKGERVIVYGGYIMTFQEYYKIPKNLSEYPFQVDDDLLFGQKNKNEFSIVDYLNHSCDPNCGFNGQLSVVAMRNIEKGEQITMDYSMCLSLNKFLNMKCMCNSDKCRGIIRGGDWKIKKLQLLYDGYYQPYIQNKINKQKM